MVEKFQIVKVESSAFAFVCLEISILLKLDISTLLKLENSCLLLFSEGLKFQALEGLKFQDKQTQKQMIRPSIRIQGPWGARSMAKTGPNK